MKLISAFILIVALIISAVKDIKDRHISIVFTGIIFATGIIIFIFDNNKNLADILIGISIGVILIILSKLTKGHIGMGDGVIICTTGVYLGGLNNILLLLNSVMLAGAYSIVLLVVKRVNRKKEIPFIPFVLIAYIGMVIF